MDKAPKEYWFNSYFDRIKIYTDPYPHETGIQNPKYSTIHGPFDSFTEALEARRELIAGEVDDRIE